MRRFIKISRSILEALMDYNEKYLTVYGTSNPENHRGNSTTRSQTTRSISKRNTTLEDKTAVLVLNDK